ncbi:MAG: hypothetical protein AABY18_09925 [Candidatus Thermoplasmatota archaeon]
MAEFQVQGEVIRFLVAWVVAALFIHFAAKIVLDRSSFLTALVVALVGVVLAVLVDRLIDGWLGDVLAIVTWMLVCALFYRTSWLKGGVVGLVAWVLFYLVTLLIRMLAD